MTLPEIPKLQAPKNVAITLLDSNQQETISYVERPGLRNLAGSKTIILLHGYSGNWKSFHLLLPLLDHFGRYSLVIPDLVGFGDSAENKTATDQSIETHCARLEAFMKALSIKKAVIIGHSFGSYIAQLFAATRPSRVQNLVLLSTNAKASNLPETNQILNSLALGTTTALLSFADTTKAPSYFQDLMKTETDRISKEVLENAAKFSLEWSGLTSEQVKSVTCPVLIISGEKDKVIDSGDSSAFAKTFEKSIATFNKMSGAGQAPHWDQPNAVADAICKFLLQ